MRTPPHILVVSGSTRTGSRSRLLCDVVSETARAAGAETRLLDLRELVLPIMRAKDPEQAVLPEVRQARKMALWADGLILTTPEYHGGISGALKNWLDFLREEIAGKLAAIITVSGSSHGGDMSATATRNSLQWCHAFVLPFTANAHQVDFRDGKLADGSVRRRIQRLTHDVMRYAPVLKSAFDEAKRLGTSVEAGFAGLHSRS